ncbi:hypothetical protein V1515DRAFT_624600, partial [Lipomyces mesembrius]
MLVLAIGDLHIPDRALELPPKFRKLLAPGKISQILCLGNLTDRETCDFLRSVSPDLQIVKGEFDLSLSLPLSKVVTHGSLRIGKFDPDYYLSDWLENEEIPQLREFKLPILRSIEQSLQGRATDASAEIEFTELEKKQM